ncbi:NUDIX hydrolase [Streptomyces longispororuber]|uniref:NUDIX hydrolase n=1 Tax=Streptomyces longispororuber TaxID=68230 RepID=UPI0027E42089|nr:NUDIX hydrolase [Streptomyces longispororuber]
MLLEPTYKDYRDIPGGYVDAGESPLQACVRETARSWGSRPESAACLPSTGPRALLKATGAVPLRRWPSARTASGADPVAALRNQGVRLSQPRRHRLPDDPDDPAPHTPGPGSRGCSGRRTGGLPGARSAAGAPPGLNSERPARAGTTGTDQAR